MDYQFLEKLQKAGLSHKEALIYAFLLEYGGGYPSGIAEATKINRSTTYKVLDTLAIKGLVADVKKGKKTFYQAGPPKHLVQLTKSNIIQAKNAHGHAEQLFPKLETLLSHAQTKPKVTFYDGKERVVDAYMSHVAVDKGYKMAVFVEVLDLREFLPEKKFRYYIREKERLGITLRGITSQEEYSYDFAKDMFTGIDKKIWPKLRFVPKKMFPFPGEITMFNGNKVSIVKFDENPVAVIIEDKSLHDMMMAVFELAWIGAENIEKKNKTQQKKENKN